MLFKHPVKHRTSLYQPKIVSSVKVEKLWSRLSSLFFFPLSSYILRFILDITPRKTICNLSGLSLIPFLSPNVLCLPLFVLRSHLYDSHNQHFYLFLTS